ncbi:hypothetical protein QZH41_018506 [Actinostola sp. cb2023]|nr:hypothetical protein QZH41_018506 [Actinostola sp. cb2023]
MSKVLKHINKKGEFVRTSAVFRNWIKADGSTPYQPAAHRYHLYVSLACPWASRTLMVRKLKGLENIISYTVVDWLLSKEGWKFTDSKPKCSLDTVNNCKTMREVYHIVSPDYDEHITVPVLWDKQTRSIVSNESSEIIRMFNSEFNKFSVTEEQKKLDLYPKHLQVQIDDLNSWIYPSINNGVYRSGFATAQNAYDTAVNELFDALDKRCLAGTSVPYLTGPTLTEADIRLFVTLVRFDMVYVGHFKCNKKRIVSNYPNMWGFVRDIYQTDGISETVDPEHIQKHYQAKVPKYSNEKGEFVRKPSVFRNWIKADGSTPYQPAAHRYHLYVSLACPWASRTLMVRKLKGLENIISYTVVDWLMSKEGWKFTDSKPKCSLDTVNNCKTMREVYHIASPDYDGRITVPVLWDKQTRSIVNNESSEIIRMFNSEFNKFSVTEEQKKLDLYPKNLQIQIDDLNSWIYPSINNGVYRSGFAMAQQVYDTAVNELFDALDKAENILSKSRYLTGPTLTEADIRLFVTLVRFDMVYVGHFKCNKKRIVSNYPNMWGFVRDIYQTDGISETVDPEHIQKHYQMSHPSVNPHGIVAIGPADLDFTSPHGRESKF